MGQLGFSYIGAIWLVMLMIPNLLWTARRPSGYSAEGENRLLAALERVGEVLLTVCSLCFADFNLRALGGWSLWLLASFLVMVLYEVWWVRYFRSPRQLEDFYSSLLGLPVAGATLPVIAFLLLAVYGKSWLLGAATVILGVGHIGIHLQHALALRGAATDNGGVR